MDFSNLYKIFISYAHNDNEEDLYLEDVRFVTDFKNRLEKLLTLRVGRKDTFEIWFDENRMDGNSKISETLRKRVIEADIFISIYTPSYKHSKWCKEELSTFVSTHSQEGEYSSIFLVEPLKNNPDEKLEPLKDIKGFLLPQRYPSKKDYLIFIDDIVDKIIKYTKFLETREPTTKELPKVYLAETTDDLEAKRNKTKRYLEGLEYEVYPKMNYPLGGIEFKELTKKDIAKCDLFVQLLSEVCGKRPPDLPQGYVKTQFEIAKELNKEIFQWIDEDIDIKDIEDSIQQELLSSEFIIKSSLDEFNQTLRRKLESLKKLQKEQKNSDDNYQQVFINAMEKDLKIANEISKILSDSVEIEFIDEDSPNIRKELEEKVLNCHHYILVFGEVPKEWVKIQLKNFKKLKNKRDKSINSLILYKAPPKMPQKDIIPIRFPCLKEIDAQETHQYEKIKEIILGCENGK